MAKADTARNRELVSVLKVLLAFVNASAGLIAAYPGPELSPLVRLYFAALVSGCGAALLFMSPPGANEPSDKTVERMVILAEERMRRRPAK